MRIALVQTKPLTGDIPANIEQHKAFIDQAILRGADMVIFPELSLTGYEPELAERLAAHANDDRFDDFQRISDTRQVTIGVGMPVRTGNGICISMILFLPNKPRRVYSKKYIHADEEPFFVSGENIPVLEVSNEKVGVAICYEISISQHTETAFRSGAQIYVASVAKFEGGVDKAQARLAEIADTFSVPVLMANSIGPADGRQCAGKSSIWNSQGKLVRQLDGSSEGILIFDTETGEVVEKVFHSV